MKLSICKNFFLSFLFFFKHIVLFILINTFCYYFFRKKLYFLLVKAIYDRVEPNFFANNNFILNLIPFFIVTTLAIIVKVGFYVIALNNDKEEIENDIIIYFSDFFNNLFYLFSGLYIFVFLFLFSLILVIPGIIFFTYCPFFSMFLIVRKTRDNKKYGQLEAISKSFSITKGQRLKLLIFDNIIIFSILFFVFKYRYGMILVGGYNVMMILRLFLIDFIIIYILNIGFNLEKIENEYIAEVEKREKESKLQQIRGISNI